MRPKILVLDEPTSNLDPKHRRELIDIFRQFNMTVLIATHDLDLISKLCQQVILLDKGEIVAEGDTN